MRTVHPYSCILYSRGEILLAGGIINGNYQASTFLYKISNGSIKKLGDLQTARKEHRMVEMEGRILVLGGESDIFGRLSSVEEFDRSTETWSPANFSLKAKRQNFALISLPGTPADYCRLN